MKKFIFVSLFIAIAYTFTTGFTSVGAHVSTPSTHVSESTTSSHVTESESSSSSSESSTSSSHTSYDPPETELNTTRYKGHTVYQDANGRYVYYTTAKGQEACTKEDIEYGYDNCKEKKLTKDQVKELNITKKTPSEKVNHHNVVIFATAAIMTTLLIMIAIVFTIVIKL